MRIRMTLPWSPGRIMLGYPLVQPTTYNSSKISLNMVELKVFSRNKRFFQHSSSVRLVSLTWYVILTPLCVCYFSIQGKSKETQCNSRPAEINATFGDSFMTCSSRTKPIIFFSSQPALNRRNIVADHAVVLILFTHIRSWCYHWPLFYVTGFYCLQVWKFVLLLYSCCRDVFRLDTLRFVIVETTFMDLKKRKLNSVLYL